MVGESSPAAEWVARPKGMHGRTFERLQQRLERLTGRMNALTQPVSAFISLRANLRWNSQPKTINQSRWTILITHGPSLGILDKGQGCPALRRAVVRLKPKLHVFGHVHSGYGMTATASTYFVNASLPDEEFELSNRPIILNFSPTL
jgi:hypothetical protein